MSARERTSTTGEAQTSSALGPVTVYTGDARAVLAGLPGDSVDCVVTSPPYWGLRDYRTGSWSGGRPGCVHRQTPSLRVARRLGTCGDCGATWTDLQHGLEPELTDYIAGLVSVFDEARRVLRPDGTVWLNLGDCYATGETGRVDAGTRYPSLAGGQSPRRERRAGQRSGLPAKNLVGVPWRVAFALQERGWWLRNAIVWAKTNPMPESVTDRLSATHEMLFLLTRNARYHFDLDAIRVPPKTAARAHRTDSASPPREQAPDPRRTESRSPRAYNPVKYAGQPPELAGRQHGPAMLAGRPRRAQHPQGKNPGDVWHLSTRPLREAHFAAYPLDIPLRCIAAGSRPGGLVLDPFSGAGTTGLAALRLGRRYLGIDLNPDYTALARKRLTEHLQNSESAKDRPS